MVYRKGFKKRFYLCRKHNFTKMRVKKMIFDSRILRITGEILFLDQEAELILRMKKISKINCLYTHYQYEKVKVQN